jgi:hypothetical protein
MSIIKPSYGTSAALTSTHLQSLASDTNALAGWSSAMIDNTSFLSDSETISYIIKAGASAPTASTNCWIYTWAALDDTPTYPDVITGSEALIALTSANVRDSGMLRQGAVITFDATANRLYYGSFNVAALYGGHMPKKWGVWAVQNSGQTLAASGNVISRADVTQYLNV